MKLKKLVTHAMVLCLFLLAKTVLYFVGMKLISRRKIHCKNNLMYLKPHYRVWAQK